VLFSLISARFPVSAGRIALHGEEIQGKRPHDVNRRGLSRSFQVTNLFHRLSVFENVRCAVLWSLGHRYAFWRSVDRLRDANERAAQVVDEIGLSARAQVAAGILSYAEQRALEIGITIAGGADVILLDEPTAGMSRTETQAAVELIRRVSRERTLLIVEHDMSVVFGLADRVSVLVHGQIIATGAPAQIRANAKVQEAYLGAVAHA
jgi:branched-chain amino acid transport system ATP-binding protein